MSTAGPLSLAEIDFYLTRAVAGAGAPFGVGEAVAAAACRRAARDRLDWDALARALGDLGNGLSAAETESDRPLSALVAGPLMAWGALDDVAIDQPDLAKDIAEALIANVPPPPAAGVFAPPGVWATIQHWFAAMLVPATDASRESGAGAGLVDED